MTTLDDAKAGVLAARSILAELEASKVDAEHELERLRAGAGATAADTVGAAEDLVRAMQVERDRIYVAEQAIETHLPRIATAERAYLALEAEALEKPVKVAQARLDKHRARTRELLDELERHEGKFVPEKGAPRRSTPLRDKVAAAEWELSLVRTMAQGGDPGDLMVARGKSPTDPASYPACIWGPDALVPAPRYAERIDQVRLDFADVDDDVRRVKADLREARGDLRDRKDLESRGYAGSTDLGTEAELTLAIELLEVRLAQLGPIRAELVRELVDLTGEEPPPDVEDELDDETAEQSVAAAGSSAA
jgi:hypothetical protein